jgi:hypothetical protein
MGRERNRVQTWQTVNGGIPRAAMQAQMRSGNGCPPQADKKGDAGQARLSKSKSIASARETHTTEAAATTRRESR